MVFLSCIMLYCLVVSSPPYCVTHSVALLLEEGDSNHTKVEREIKPFGSGGAHVTAPKDWIGADVKLVRTSPPTDDE